MGVEEITSNQLTGGWEGAPGTLPPSTGDAWVWGAWCSREGVQQGHTTLGTPAALRGTGADPRECFGQLSLPPLTGRAFHFARSPGQLESQCLPLSFLLDFGDLFTLLPGFLNSGPSSIPESVHLLNKYWMNGCRWSSRHRELWVQPPADSSAAFIGGALPAP